jgi:hypothetical protein
MAKIQKCSYKKILSLTLLTITSWLWQQNPVHAASTSRAPAYVNYNCADFGTRERAQSEFNKFSYDRYGLDSDGDGQVCEWNPSAGKWAWGASVSGLLFGRYAGKRKRYGADGVLPLPKGLFVDWKPDGNGGREAEFEEGTIILAFMCWIPYLAMTILRDRVYSISTPPMALALTALALGFGFTYWAASTKETWI